MRIFYPLKERPMAWLWGGQLLSNIGDEIYNVALIWLAADLIGLKTGFLTSLQAGAIFACSLFGGVWADRWDHRKTLIFSDLIRGVVVLFIPLAAHFGYRSLWLLIVVALIVSGLNAFFTPALYALLPEVIQEETHLAPANGLLESTTRFARVVGPGLVGALSRFIPLIHFFTVDSFSFFVSAISVNRITTTSTPVEPVASSSVWQTACANLKSGWDLIRDKPLIRFSVLSGAIVNPAWYLVLPLGLALILHSHFPTRVGLLGLVICAYGVGNISSNLIFGSFSYRRPEFLLFAGRMLAGIGFIGISLSPSLKLLMATACFSAVGGPMTDIGIVTLWQNEFRRINLARIYRLSLAVSFGSLLVVLGVSPFFFERFGVSQTIGAGGWVLVVVGAYGFWRFKSASSASKKGA